MERGREDSSVPDMLEVKVPMATKDGDVIKFEIHTVTTMTDYPSCEMTTSRSFEDVEWLHNSLAVREDPGGCIVPPLPSRPASNAAETEALTKQQYGDTRNMLADEIPKFCRSVEMFLNLLAQHVRYRRSPVLRQFLINKDLPPHVVAKRGLLQRASTAMKDKNLQNRKDPDEYFHEQRQFIGDGCLRMHECNMMFHHLLVAQRQFAMTLGSFSSDVSKASADHQSTPGHARMMAGFGQVLGQLRQGENSLTAANEKTFSFTFSVFEKYMESARDMLNRRLRLMAESESAAAAAVKAKPSNKAKAEEVREIAAQKFDEVSKVARTELSQFHQLRVRSLQNALIGFAEAQISTGRDMYAMLARSLSELKHMDATN